MKLYAISDLHLRHETNRKALEELPDFPEDWLIVAGDVSESTEHLELTCRLLTRRFARVIWVPGNHDLWTVPRSNLAARGEARYQLLVEICRKHGVVTPEDPYLLWPGSGPPTAIAPLFLLYDYSFRPDEVREEDVLAWAEEEGILCTDEVVLHPDPHASRQAWCVNRCELTERRLAALPSHLGTVLINHWPLRQDLVRLYRIPRFSPWCGTRRSEDWHLRFRARVVVSGHLHIRSTDWRQGTRFEEVSLGYPKQWRRERGIAGYLREILPGPLERPASA